MKKRKLLIVLSALIFIFACLCSFICSIIKTNEISNTYGYVTMVETMYYQNKSGWWVFFAFLPILILFIVLAYKHKDRIVLIVSSGLAIILIFMGFIFLKNTKNYSTSTEYLTQIENDIEYDFPDDTTILIDKTASDMTTNDNINVKFDGIIRIPSTEQAKNELANNISWQNSIDDTIQQYIPEFHYSQISDLGKYYYRIDENNVMTFLSYCVDYDLIYFTVVEIL